MIIKNNNQNSVNTTTFSVSTGPKRWVRTAACSPTPSLIPRSWVTATSSNRETEARRDRGQDVEGHLDTSSCAPQEATDNTWWRPSSHRKPSSVDEGGWGRGRPRRDSRGVPSPRTSSLPRDPSFVIDLCMSLCGKAMPRWLGTEGHWERIY